MQLTREEHYIRLVNGLRELISNELISISQDNICYTLSGMQTEAVLDNSSEHTELTKILNKMFQKSEQQLTFKSATNQDVVSIINNFLMLLIPEQLARLHYTLTHYDELELYDELDTNRQTTTTLLDTLKSLVKLSFYEVEEVLSHTLTIENDDVWGDEVLDNISNTHFTVSAHAYHRLQQTVAVMNDIQKFYHIEVNGAIKYLIDHLIACYETTADLTVMGF